MGGLTRSLATLGIVAALAGQLVSLHAAEPELRTLTAYEQYVANAKDAFLKRIEREHQTRHRTSPIALMVRRPDRAHGQIVKVPGGLVHHWNGGAFIDGVTLAQVLSVAQAYDNYAAVHRPVKSARVLSRDGETFHLAMRVKEDAGPISGVLDVWSDVTYTYIDDGAYSFSEAREIRQVKNAGLPNERYEPAGRDGGFVWRANTFTRFVERDGGVRIELETLALSRPFPVLLGWMLEPIARRLGRTSVERTLDEFRRAVLNLAA